MFKFSKMNLDNLNNKVGTLLLLSGLSGFCLGMLYARYQAAVDYAQVIAGIVKYPSSNPFYLASVKAWSVLIQLSALFLRLGVSEKVISYVLSGIAGMISFQALALGVLVLSRNFVFSLLSSFFIFLIHGIWVGGTNYSLNIMGTDGTFTMIGFSFTALVVALIAIGRIELRSFLLGIAPSIHPTHGLWSNRIVLICFFINIAISFSILIISFLFYVISKFCCISYCEYHSNAIHCRCNCRREYCCPV